MIVRRAPTADDAPQQHLQPLASAWAEERDQLSKQRTQIPRGRQHQPRLRRLLKLATAPYPGAPERLSGRVPKLLFRDPEAGRV